MKQDIINLEQYADALRSTGYKNIESAVSEIVDNSLEANAADVLIIVKNKVAPNGRKCVSEVAFLDNGYGMDKELVQSCLRIGYGTRTDRKGMGRFGVGLPQASMHVCPLVEVYAWQNGVEKCYKSYLDINKIKSGEQKYLDESEETSYPEEYKEYLEFYYKNKHNIKFLDHGTLIVWKYCDNISPKTVIPLFDRLELALGQKFRYWINDFTKNLYLINDENHEDNRTILPNDPLMLMERNVVLGNPNKPKNLSRSPEFITPIFEPFTNEINKEGIVEFPIKYIDKKTNIVMESKVNLRFSVVKRDFYDVNAFPGGNPGKSPIGKHLRKLEGISIVRSNREIDFGTFDFYSNLNEPEHRWWGCEILFQPELDEVFGVSNNKQHVELIELLDEEFEDDEVKPVWIQLKSIIKETIKEMANRNKEIRRSTRIREDIQKPSEEIINNSEEDNNTITESEKTRETKQAEEIREEAINTLYEQGINEPTNEEVDQLLLNKVNIIYKNNGTNNFIDYSSSLGICKCIININHIFFQKFMQHIENDREAKISFELFIASLIRARDEITGDNMKVAYDEVIGDWNYKLTKYIRKLRE